ncbi:MAG: hypothetical protein OEL52_05115 [Nitrosopumilus sp.]|nr:hypothetical protein [Nitrosopumilus sp.]
MRLNVQYLGFFLIVSVLLFASSAIQASAEDVSRPKQQTDQGVSTDDVVCKEGLELVWKYDGTPACVEPENVLKLVKSGWISQETIDRISISDKRTHEVSENVYAFQFDYCAAMYNEGALGLIVSSDTEKIPVQIDPNIQTHQCQQYGTQILAMSESSLKVSLFYEKDMQKLFKIFDKKRTNLEDDLVHYQQKLLRLQDPNLDENNLEKISQLKIRIDLINHVIQSYKEGLNTFRALQ